VTGERGCEIASAGGGLTAKRARRYRRSSRHRRAVGGRPDARYASCYCGGLLHGLGAEEEEEQDEVEGGLADEVEGGSVGGRAAGTGRRWVAQYREEEDEGLPTRSKVVLPTRPRVAVLSSSSLHGRRRGHPLLRSPPPRR